MTPFLAGDIARDEDLRLKAYPDPISPLAKARAQGVKRLDGLSGEPWTIGYGHCGPEVHEGLVWTLQQARDALKADIAKAVAALDANAPWWRSLSDPRQDALANMAFNLGWTRLSGFKNTLAAMKRGDFEAAAQGMLASKWASQVKGRAKRLAEQMRTGVRQP